MSQRTLVMVLHGMSSSPARFDLVKKTIESCLKGADVKVPPLPISRISLADPLTVVAELLAQLDTYWASNAYDKIILVGHSAGAVLARKLYVCACGNYPDSPLEGSLMSSCAAPRPWAAAVERIILLAGMNNGWSIDYHMSLARGLMFHIGVIFGRVMHLVARRWPFIFHLRRGAPFLTQLRIQWLIMRCASAKDGSGRAPVIQLLGTVDDLVSPRDNIDLVSGRDFYFLDVAKSGHANVIEMDESLAGRIRQQALKLALSLSPDELRNVGVPVSDVNPVSQEPEIQEVVFVIHGIRDEGFWTDKIGRAVVLAGKAAGRRFARITSTYGYFGMFPFLFPWTRLQKVEWLMNQYAEAIARYPNATRFHYVGHSNGTWLLASALKQYTCCRFKHVVFAGSVVPSRYDWLARLAKSQVESVLNYAATRDWVVAYFPNLFESIPIQDLGGAGHIGFVQGRPNEGNVRNVEYVVGEHSAALQEENWEDIADFVVRGRWPLASSSPVHLAPKHASCVGIFGRLPILVWIGVLGMLAIFPGILIYGLKSLRWAEWLVTALMLGYFALIVYIGRRV
jgi:pimeloyl-ACP methyl ester carboxylesterase